MGLPVPNTSRYPPPGRFSGGWNAFPIFRGTKVVRVTVLVLIMFLWLCYFTSNDVTTTGQPQTWLETIEKPARQAGGMIVEFVSTQQKASKVKLKGSEASPSPKPKKHKSHHKSSNGTNKATQPTWYRGKLPDVPPEPLDSHERFLTLSTMVKNQRRWIREWLEFNIMMGVEHFIIYDNGSNDDTLDVVQYYIDEGIVEWIPWPPKEVPKKRDDYKTVMEEWQDSWYIDCLETCLDNDWKIHKQGPCQLAAFTDAIRRTSGGKSRWLGIWDVDEYIFPKEKAPYQTLADMLQGEYEDTRHIRIWGNVFGTNGHVSTPKRREGNTLHPLLTEEYTRRAQLDHNGEYPFAKVEADGWEVYGKGKLKYVRFGGADMYARKSLADPDMVSHSYVHHFEAPGNSGPQWKELKIDVHNELWQFNHYAYLSQEDARKKSMANKNPFMDFNQEIDSFFSREEDKGIQYLVPELKERMLQRISEHPPKKPDDWVWGMETAKTYE